MGYVAFYLCRRNLSIILPVFAHDRIYTASQSAELVLIFSIAYCLGQFVMGGLADRIGGRNVVVGGMVVSALVTAAMGFSSDFAEVVACQVVNGVAQATGWAGLMKMMKQQPMQRRGIVMGWWSTNYVAGGFVATVLATYALASSWISGDSWRKAAWLPALALFAFAGLFWFFTRNVESPANRSIQTHRISYVSVVRLAFLTMRTRALIGAYFFVKLIRYSLLFWLPLYMTSHLQMTPTHAGYASSRLEGYGIAGVLGAGYLSDILFKARRFPVAALLMFLLAIICVFASHLGLESSDWRIGVVIALLGFMIYGADTILVGAATQDAARLEHMGTLAGVVDGAGSLGQVLSPLLIVFVSERFGWPSVFQALAMAAVACSILLVSSVRLERGDPEVV
jgi:sugar phosphate permease